MATAPLLVLVALALATCEGAPRGHDRDIRQHVVPGTVEVEVEPLGRELRVAAGELGGAPVPGGLVFADFVPSSAVPDGVPAVPTEDALPLRPTEDAVSEATQRPTTPNGLPDNDAIRRRLFFIGDLADDDSGREPSRLLLPPPAEAIAAPTAPTAAVDAVTHVPEPSRQLLPPAGVAEESAAPANDKEVTVDADAAAPLVHEKDGNTVVGLLRRPGHRLSVRHRAEPAASRDEEIRAAMEASDVFQGPFPEQGARQSRSMVGSKTVKPGDNVYRWSVPRH